MQDKEKTFAESTGINYYNAAAIKMGENIL